MTRRLSDTLRERGVTAWPRLPPQKDWNEAVKARYGLPAQPSEEHPQLLAAGPVCGRVLARSGEIGTGRVAQQLPILLDGCASDLRWNCPEKAAALPGLFQEVLREDAARGVRTAAEKKVLAERWLDFAASCAVISVKHEAEQSQQPEEKFIMKMG